MKLLFITRKYPPAVGGMENVSFALANEFSQHTDTTTIAWGGPQLYWPLFAAIAFLQSCFLIPRKKITHLHLGDGLLSPLGCLLKFIFKIKCSVTIHGLDITSTMPLYQLIAPRCVGLLDRIICISRATRDECIQRGINPQKCTVIPNGVYTKDFKLSTSLKDLESITGKPLVNKKILVTVGRLVKRKGVYWFIQKVFHRLSEDYIYIVVGHGPEKLRIQRLVSSLNLDDRIIMLGKISDHDVKKIYNTAHLFIMPNIYVPGDMEGFGVVALEASSSGLPVIASAIDGITDAVVDNQNGLLLQHNINLWIKKIPETINKKVFSRQKVSRWTDQNYNWSVIGSKYINTLANQ
jgi:glycosyltransferase involved in cell wall biosynthesis